MELKRKGYVHTSKLVSTQIEKIIKSLKKGILERGRILMVMGTRVLESSTDIMNE